MRAKQRGVSSEGLVSLFTVLGMAGVVAVLYFGRVLLVPLSLAILLTFMLSPMVGRLEKITGRVTAVFGLVLLISIFCCFAGWVITRQSLDLMSRIPDYRANIEKKIQAMKIDKDSPIKRFSGMVVDVESEIPWLSRGTPDSTAKSPRGLGTPIATPAAAPVPVDPMGEMRSLVGPFLAFLGSVGVVTLLVIFMLLKREDLRARFIKIVGHGRISATTRAMEDAGDRVSRYLIAQLVVNLVFGTAIAGGLALIGIPNVFLWGALAALLRFIPYIGVIFAAAGPIILALAISPGWGMLLLTALLFSALELVTGNVLEPLLFRSSTGISSLALIGAAIFWAWLWGPVGLILSTPLTVCVAVIGKHVRRLSFFSVLLGNEDALTPVEECYHRLLVGGQSEAGEVIEMHVKTGSVLSLYDTVLLPALAMAEREYGMQELEEEQRLKVSQGVREIIDDLNSRPPVRTAADKEQRLEVANPAGVGNFDLRVACIPVKAERDELAGNMLAHLLRDRGVNAVAPGLGLTTGALISWMDEKRIDLAFVSVVSPSSVAQARQLCSRLRAGCPILKIVVGLWGAMENQEANAASLHDSGADRVVALMETGIGHAIEFAAGIVGDSIPAPIPEDEELRLIALRELQAYSSKSDPLFDRMTRDMTRTFDVPIALLTLIDHDKQLFKSQFGMPAEMASVCEIPRDASVCSHVVSANSILVVEDLARDRRFANNPILKANQLHFYAGVPLHAANGQPIGALCILDTKPRNFTEAERRMLTIMGEVMSDEISSHIAVKPESFKMPGEVAPLSSA